MLISAIMKKENCIIWKSYAKVSLRKCKNVNRVLLLKRYLKLIYNINIDKTALVSRIDSYQI